jgi:hypothetical protein
VRSQERKPREFYTTSARKYMWRKGLDDAVITRAFSLNKPLSLVGMGNHSTSHFAATRFSNKFSQMHVIAVQIKKGDGRLE